MLQRIIAVVLLVAGVVGVALGVASATVWRDSDTVVATTSYTGDGTMLVTEPGVLDLVDDEVTIRATAPGEQEVTLAIGRDVDVEGWVGEDPHGVVTGLASWESLATQEGTAPEPTDAAATDEATDAATDEATDAATDEATDEATDAATDEATEEAPDAPVTGVDPAGSDMWLAEASGAGSATLRWSDQQGRWRLLAAGVGEDAVAPTLELSWPREVTTPWLWPAVIGGGVLILIGLGVGAAALRSGRRKTSGRRGTTAPTPAVTTPGTAPATGPDDASSGTASDVAGRPLTRRELREREEAERLAQQEARAQRPRRAWLTGQIPVVSKERRPKTAAQPVVDPAPASPEPLDVNTTRADAWRRTWGFSATTSSGTTGTGAAPEHGTNDETKDTTP